VAEVGYIRLRPFSEFLCALKGMRFTRQTRESPRESPYFRASTRPIVIRRGGDRHRHFDCAPARAPDAKPDGPQAFNARRWPRGRDEARRGARFAAARGSKQFRFGKIEVFEVLKNRLILCGSKLVATLITQELSSVLFLPRPTL
jgi:hypothetical protein